MCRIREGGGMVDPVEARGRGLWICVVWVRDCLARASQGRKSPGRGGDRKVKGKRDRAWRQVREPGASGQ